MEEGAFDRFFTLIPWRRTSEERQAAISDADIQAASLDVAFSQHPSYERFMDWLDKEADRPVAPRAELHDMISGITRQNTMKEVRDHLRRQTAQAKETLTRHRESENG